VYTHKPAALLPPVLTCPLDIINTACGIVWLTVSGFIQNAIVKLSKSPLTELPLVPKLGHDVESKSVSAVLVDTFLK